MKKTLFIGLLTIFPLILFSQNKNIEFGIKGGINYSNYIDNIDLNLFTHIPADYNGKIGFYIGAYSNIGINELISIKPELLISKTGSKAIIELGWVIKGSKKKPKYNPPKDSDLVIKNSLYNDIVNNKNYKVSRENVQFA